MPALRRRVLLHAFLPVLAAALHAQGGAGGKYGGRAGQQPTAQELAVEATIARGLSWLAAHQDENGMWSASLFMRHDPKAAPCDGPGKPDQDFHVTTLAACAFLARFNTVHSGLHQDQVRRATDWILARQRDDGFLGEPAIGNSMVSHAMACFALCESAGLAGKGAIDDAARRATKCLEELRRTDGTWPRSRNADIGDAEASFWACVSLSSAKFFKFTGASVADVPDLLAQTPSPPPGLPPAAAAFAAIFTGRDPKTDPWLGEVCRGIAAAPPHWPAKPQEADFLGWYLGTMTLCQCGGDPWKAWVGALLAETLPHQRTDGVFAGSWDPVDVRGKEGGRVYATSMQLLALASVLHYQRLLK